MKTLLEIEKFIKVKTHNWDFALFHGADETIQDFVDDLTKFLDIDHEEDWDKGDEGFWHIAHNVVIDKIRQDTVKRFRDDILEMCKNYMEKNKNG